MKSAVLKSPDAKPPIVKPAAKVPVVAPAADAGQGRRPENRVQSQNETPEDASPPYGQESGGISAEGHSSLCSKWHNKTRERELRQGPHRISQNPGVATQQSGCKRRVAQARSHSERSTIAVRRHELAAGFRVVRNRFRTFYVQERTPQGVLHAETIRLRWRQPDGGRR